MAATSRNNFWASFLVPHVLTGVAATAKTNPKKAPTEEENLASELRAPESWSTSEDVLVEQVNIYDGAALTYFADSLDGFEKVDVLKVYIVQNIPLYQKFILHRYQVAKKLGKSPEAVERRLWHGTTEKSAKAIVNTRFDRAFAGDRRKDGYSSKGKGCYFAVRSGYAANDAYASPDSNDERFVFMCRVVTGDHCQGKENIKTLPAKPGGGFYDSVVDSMADPKMFVVFDDAAAYPEYLIKFKTNGGVPPCNLIG